MFFTFSICSMGKGTFEPFTKGTYWNIKGRLHEIRQQRVSRTISPLEAHRSPSTVGASMSHSSSAVLLQHNTICIQRKSPEIYNF